MNKFEQTRVESLSKYATFTEIPVSPHYNVRLFRIKARPDPIAFDFGQNVVFIAPKLWMNAGVKSQNSKWVSLANGTLDVSFPLLFVDPRQTIWSNPNYRTEVEIPEPLRVNALPGLTAELLARFGKDVSVAVLPGVAKSAFLKIGDQYLQASAYQPELPKSDQLSETFPWKAHFQIQDIDANYLLNTAMPAQNASIEIFYQLALSYPAIKYSLEVSRQGLFDYIQNASFNRGSDTWCQATVRMIASQAVRNETRKIQIPNSGTASLESLITDVIEALFDPFSPSSNSLGTAASASCYRLKSSLSQNAPQTIQVDWDIRNQVLTDQMISIGTLLPPRLN
jgi:hypothetical protein